MPANLPGHVPPPEAVARRDDCFAGFVAASAAELGGLEDLLHEKVFLSTAALTLRRGMLQDQPVVLVPAGSDAGSMVHAVDVLLDGHRPLWVVLSGWATSLCAEVPRGAVVIATALVDDGAQHLALPAAAQVPRVAGSDDARRGLLYCTGQSLDEPRTRRSLGAHSGALASVGPVLAAARRAQQRGAAVLAVYLVHCGVDEQPPAELRNLRRQRSWAGKLGALVGALVRRPGSVKDLYREKEQSLLATDQLGRFLAGMVEQLAPPRGTA